MLIENMHTFKEIMVPDNLKNIVYACATCGLKYSEINVINFSITALSNYINNNPFTIRPFCILCFADNSELKINWFGENTLGQTIHIALLRMDLMREYGYSQVSFVLAILEELCHCLFQIANEYLVKLKVFEIVDNMFPGVTLSSAYPDMFDENNQPKYCAAYATDFESLS